MAQALDQALRVCGVELAPARIDDLVRKDLDSMVAASTVHGGRCAVPRRLQIVGDPHHLGVELC